MLVLDADDAGPEQHLIAFCTLAPPQHIQDPFIGHEPNL